MKFGGRGNLFLVHKIEINLLVKLSKRRGTFILFLSQNFTNDYSLIDNWLYIELLSLFLYELIIFNKCKEVIYFILFHLQIENFKTNIQLKQNRLLSCQFNKTIILIEKGFLGLRFIFYYNFYYLEIVKIIHHNINLRTCAMFL